MTEFIRNGAITEEGQTLVDYIEAALEKARPAAEFNKLSGPLKWYGTTVGANLLTKESWLTDYAYGAESIWQVMQLEKEEAERIAAQESEAAAQSEKVSVLETELAALRAELVALREAQEKPAKKTAKKDEAEAEAEES